MVPRKGPRKWICVKASGFPIYFACHETRNEGNNWTGYGSDTALGISSLLRPPWDKSQGFWVGCYSHHPAMAPRSRSARLFGRRTLASRTWTLRGRPPVFRSLVLLLPASARLRTTRSKRREKYASGSTRSCFYPEPFAAEPVHNSVVQVLSISSFGGAKKWKSGHAQRRAWAHDQLVSPPNWSSQLPHACMWLFIPWMNHRSFQARFSVNYRYERASGRGRRMKREQCKGPKI